MVRAALIALLLAGCATTPRTVEIRVPVPADCPAPVVPARPVLPVGALAADAPPADVARAYAASVEALMGYAMALELLLGAY